MIQTSKDHHNEGITISLKEVIKMPLKGNMQVCDLITEGG